MDLVRSGREDGRGLAGAAAVVVEVVGQINGIGVFLGEVDGRVVDAVGGDAVGGAVLFKVGGKVAGGGHFGGPILIDVCGLPSRGLDAVVVDGGLVAVGGVGEGRADDEGSCVDRKNLGGISLWSMMGGGREDGLPLMSQPREPVRAQPRECHWNLELCFPCMALWH